MADGIPGEAAAAARDTLGGAVAVAGQLPDRPARWARRIRRDGTGRTPTAAFAFGKDESLSPTRWRFEATSP
jgi:hypothetical protein